MGVQMKRMHLMHSPTCSGHLEPWIERWGSIRLLLLVCLILILGQPLVSFAQPVALSPPQLDQLVAAHRTVS